MPALAPLIQRVLDLRRRTPPGRALLVSLSGIDGAGKGFVARRLAAGLRGRGPTVALLSADAWLNLPDVRLGGPDPASRFYEQAFRFRELFHEVVLPLRATRAVRHEANVVTETATRFARHLYDEKDVDVIVLEGIFLFKREWRALHDLAVWVDCSFATALKRALARGQEGLPEAETRRAYETIYFPAQRLHFARDAPRAGADFIFPNEA